MNKSKNKRIDNAFLRSVVEEINKKKKKKIKSTYDDLEIFKP